MKFIFSFLICLILIFTGVKLALASVDPTSVANNKFGIHILEVTDLKDAANLVNSSGGDWGYVTLVIQKTQRDTNYWQKVFDEARRLHLIPIVRLATMPLGDIWEKPNFGEIDGWVGFLNSLNWVVKNRYVVVGNEPNHAKEWGGQLNPEEYAQYLSELSRKLKAVSQDFFILPAGFDASSPNSKETLDEAQYLRRMLSSQLDLFNQIDGWASHSYPNPGFSGSENGFGRGSVRTFIWELDLLKSLGVTKDLPVFITETGWVHNVGIDQVGGKFKFAYDNVWNDSRVVAVTPFVLSYNSEPFAAFSWKSQAGQFYPFYAEVQALAKQAGNPIQEDRAEITKIFIQPFHLADSTFTGIALVKNTGQAIWQKEGLSLIGENNRPYEITTVSFSTLEPGHSGLIVFKGNSPSRSGVHSLAVTLVKEKPISESGNFQIITLSPIKMQFDVLFAKILRFFAGH